MRGACRQRSQFAPCTLCFLKLKLFFSGYFYYSPSISCLYFCGPERESEPASAAKLLEAAVGVFLCRCLYMSPSSPFSLLKKSTRGATSWDLLVIFLGIFLLKHQSSPEVHIPPGLSQKCWPLCRVRCFLSHMGANSTTETWPETFVPVLLGCFCGGLSKYSFCF